MRQHLSEDYCSETQVKFASHFHQTFFFFLFFTCMLANEVQKVKIYNDFYYTNLKIISDVVSSFVLLCLLCSLNQKCSHVLGHPVQAQTTCISRVFMGCHSVSFFFHQFSNKKQLKWPQTKQDNAELSSSTDPTRYLCFAILLPKLLKKIIKIK